MASQMQKLTGLLLHGLKAAQPFAPQQIMAALLLLLVRSLWCFTTLALVRCHAQVLALQKNTLSPARCQQMLH
jgi:hypothetical protein